MRFGLPWIFVSGLVGCVRTERQPDGGIDDAVDAQRASDSGEDSSVHRDAAPDATDDAGWPSYPDCNPQLQDILRARANSTNLQAHRAAVALTITASDESGFRAEIDPLADPPDEGLVGVSFPAPAGVELDLPQVGQEVLVLGGSCESPEGYVRVMDTSGVVLWEGGAPFCADSYEWDDAPYLGTRSVEGAAVCIDRMGMPPMPPECGIERREHEVLLPTDGDSVLVPGEEREIEIGGLRYYASAQGAFSISVRASCVEDLSGASGAFIAKLRE